MRTAISSLAHNIILLKPFTKWYCPFYFLTPEYIIMKKWFCLLAILTGVEVNAQNNKDEDGPVEFKAVVIKLFEKYRLLSDSVDKANLKSRQEGKALINQTPYGTFDGGMSGYYIDVMLRGLENILRSFTTFERASSYFLSNSRDSFEYGVYIHRKDSLSGHVIWKATVAERDAILKEMQK
jgi:hypothetical protein